MQILVNGEPHTIQSNATLTTLLEELNVQTQRLAVEVNEEIVPRSEWQTFSLSTDDKVEIVKAVGGG